MTITEAQALWLAAASVATVVSTVITAVLTGWVIALRHQTQVNNRRLAFLEHDYEDRHGVHPFKVQYADESRQRD